MLKRQDLDRLHQSGKLPTALMLFGESHFLIDRYIKMLSSIADANLLTLYYDAYNFTKAKEHLSQGSLFGGLNILVIKNEKKVPKADLDTLVGLCEKNPDNILLYGYFGSDFKTSNKAFIKKKHADFVRFYAPYLNEAKSIVMQDAQAKGIQLDQHSATHLLLTQNSDLSLACNELDKLAILQKPITIKDIDDLVYGLGEVKLEELLNNLIAKKDFRQDLERILESGEDEIRIITALSAYITQLYLFYAYIKVNGAPDAKAILGYNPPAFVVKDKANLAIKFQQHTYAALVKLLLDSELTMKNQKNVDKEAILLATLIQMQRLL